MEYCFLRGFLVVLLIQRGTAEGQSTSVQSSTTVTLQDGHALPQEPELPSAEVAPVVAAPSLKEVQLAVQEASEQVEGRAAEEVLKELLERVVEAALGQVEGGGEVKADEAAEQEGVQEDALGVGRGETESDTEVEVLQQVVEEDEKEEEVEEIEGEDIGANGGDTGVEEQQEEVEVNTFEDDSEDEKIEETEGEVETAAGTMDETTAGGETGGREAEGVEVIDESIGTEISQEVGEETGAALEETGGYLAVEDAGLEENKEQDEVSEEEEADEGDTQVVEEAPAVVEVSETEQETVAERDIQPSIVDVEQVEDIGGKVEAVEDQTQVDELEGEAIAPLSDNSEEETTQSEVEEPLEEEEEEEEGEEEANVVEDVGVPEEEDDQGHLVVEEEAEGGEVGEAGDSVTEEESVSPVGLGDQQTEEEEKITLETTDSSEKDQEELVISAPEPEDGADTSIVQNPELQAPTTGPSLGTVETEENTPGEKSNHGSDIITPVEDLLSHDPVVAQPTLDDVVKDVEAEPPQAGEGEEPGEANELVEDEAGRAETSELGLEAWKIGAISAAVFLVVETIVIIIYILKRRNKSSSLALQRACEEGCVEPEAATGGDCSDDTLPAGNGDSQQIAALNLSDAASTPAPNKEQQEHAIAMADLPPSSAEESANSGPGPDSSQDLRTSTL